jgi:ABC-2 type transport system permease protein
MITRISSMMVKELIQFRRDWVLAAFILLAPMLQLTLLARNTGQGIVDQPVAILDQDRSRLSRQLVATLDNAEELTVRYHLAGMDEVRQLLDQGRARLAVIIPTGFAREFQRHGSTPQVQVLADASNALAASVSMGAATGAVRRLEADLADNGALGNTPALSSGPARAPIDFRSDIRFNPTLDYQVHSIPAQLGFITYQVTLALGALGLARERELGTLEQLMVTPLRGFELTLGKGLPAAAIGILNFGFLMLISRTVYQVPMNGSLALLFALTLLFVAAIVGWGLVLSAISRTQQQAILLVFILAMVEFTFSGFMVPVENIPPLLQAISRIAPLQHYLVIIRGIMLKGAGLRELWPQALALGALAMVTGLAALRIIARRME